jgi:hypothetical protein
MLTLMFILGTIFGIASIALFLQANEDIPSKEQLEEWEKKK